MPSELLGPSAVIFAALFSGTVGIWLGSRLQLGRFKHEKAFERRVEWYERIMKSLQRIRDVVWEFNTTLSTIPAKRYADQSTRLTELVREFHQVAAERHYAKPTTIEAIRGLGLTALSLERNIPGQRTGRKAGVFWLEQHNDWGKAYKAISEDLEEELFRNTQFLRRGVRRKRRDAATTLAEQGKSPRGGWISKLRMKVSPSPDATTKGANAPAAPAASTEQVEDDGEQVIFDAIWATIKRRELLENGNERYGTEILNAVQCGLLRIADLRSLLSLLQRLRESARPREGWQRQHIGRLLALSEFENADQFDKILTPEFNEVVSKIAGSEGTQQLRRLADQHDRVWRELRLKLQPFRNSIVARKYPNPKLDIQALQGVQLAEIEAVGYKQLQWITELISLLTRIWNEWERAGPKHIP